MGMCNHTLVGRQQKMHVKSVDSTNTTRGQNSRTSFLIVMTEYQYLQDNSYMALFWGVDLQK